MTIVRVNLPVTLLQSLSVGNTSWVLICNLHFASSLTCYDHPTYAPGDQDGLAGQTTVFDVCCAYVCVMCVYYRALFFHQLFTVMFCSLVAGCQVWMDICCL